MSTVNCYFDGHGIGRINKEELTNVLQMDLAIPEDAIGTASIEGLVNTNVSTSKD